jgi:hypothetical protein
MAEEENNLEDLIVRALTHQDSTAREALDTASREDPELKRFYDDLNQVINTLARCKDWRSEAPSATLKEKVRQAVRAKMSQAPPRFRAVILDADLGREKATRRVVYALLILLAAGLLIALALWMRPREDSGKLKLTGQRPFEAVEGKDPAGAWAAQSSDPADANLAALAHPDDGVNTIYLQKGFGADAALAFQVEVEVPDLDEKTSVMVFLADAAGSERPTLTSTFRPEQALYVEITLDSIVLYHGGQLLKAKPISNAKGFYALRLEHLGSHVRAVINNEVLCEAPVTQVLKGPLHPGLRTAGPRKSQFRFNKVWVER